MLTVKTLTSDVQALTVASQLARQLGEKTNATIDVSDGMVMVTVSSKRNFSRSVAATRRILADAVDDSWFDAECDTHFFTDAEGFIVSVERVYYW